MLCLSRYHIVLPEVVVHHVVFNRVTDFFFSLLSFFRYCTTLSRALASVQRWTYFYRAVGVDLTVVSLGCACRVLPRWLL